MSKCLFDSTLGFSGKLIVKDGFEVWSEIAIVSELFNESSKFDTSFNFNVFLIKDFSENKNNLFESFILVA